MGSNMSAPPRGISGRWFTIVFGIILAIGVVVGFSVVVRFQEIMTALDSVRSLWPDAAAVLEKRYQAIDELVSQTSASESRLLEIPLYEWEQARSEFKSSTQYDVQAREIERLETLANLLAPTQDGDSATKIPPVSLEKFLQADRALGSLQADVPGWLCTQLFRMNIPNQVYSFLE